MQQTKATVWAYAIPAAAAAVTISPYSPNIGDVKMASAPSTVAPTQPTQSLAFVDERVFTAKLEAVEARTDTKFERLISKIDGLAVTLAGVAKDVGEIDAKVLAVDAHARSAKSTIIATIIGAAIGVAALAFAAVSIFQAAMGTTATAYQSGMAAAEAHK